MKLPTLRRGKGGGGPPEASPLTAEFGASTHPGRVRPKNEDYLLTEVPDDPAVAASRGSLFLVADGVGGLGGGAIASAEAAHTVLQEYYLDRHGDPGRSLRRAVLRANLHIYNMRVGHPDLSGMQTTLSVLAVCRGRYWICHAGDSKVFLLRRGMLRQLTRDHTMVEEMRKLGLVETAGTGRHRHRHLLTRTVGGDPLLGVEFSRGGCQAGDCYILATDGIFEHLSLEDVRDTFTNSPPAEAAAACVEEANRRGGFDNLTVVGVRLIS